MIAPDEPAAAAMAPPPPPPLPEPSASRPAPRPLLQPSAICKSGKQLPRPRPLPTPTLPAPRRLTALPALGGAKRVECAGESPAVSHSDPRMCEEEAAMEALAASFADHEML